MKLYLFRHGHALTTMEARVKSDDERPLSDQGVAAVRQMSDYLKHRGVTPGVILHSPLKRACETAVHIASSWPTRPTVELFDPLSNVLGPVELYEKLKERSNGIEEIFAVGHQPQLGELAQFLGGAAYPLRPAGVIALETGDKQGRTLWSFNPEDLT